jgi:hypothetical protein
MGHITGGSVTFGRTIQPAQYESKKSEVTVTFAVAENETRAQAQALLDGAASMAQTKALELVGLKPAKVEPKVEEPKADPLAKVVDEERPGSKRSPGRPPKAAEKPPETPAEDPLALAESTAEAANEAAEAAQHKDADEDLLAGAAAPQPISDKEILDAVTKKMAEISNGPAIKAVREKFVQTPKGVRDIPQEKRKEFLEELAKLKK